MSYVRIGTYDGDPGSLEEGFNQQTEALRQLDGFERGYFGVDRSQNKAVSVTFWESEDALNASAEAARRMRDDATSPSGAATTDVTNYEVVITLE